MAQQKRRTTHYQINKGVNEKTSKYTLSDAQVTSLYNMDFDKPNALTKRPGSTQMVTAGTSGPINSLFEFESLSGESYLLAGSDTALFNVTGGSYAEVSTGYSNGQPLDILAFTDRAYFANGETFQSWTGDSLYQYSLTAPNATFFFYLTSIGASSGPDNIFGLPVSSQYQYSWNYTFTRQDGFESNYSPGQRVVLRGANNGFTNINFDGVPGLSAPANTSFINFYLAIDSSSLGFAGVSVPVIDLTNFNFDPSLAPQIPKTAYKFITTIPLGTTSISFQYDAFDFEEIVNSQRSLFTNNFNFTSTYIPKYIEINQNRLFQAGFSVAPSTVFFSNIGEPERVEPENFFEVRTNDSDVITAIKSYQDQLIIFKRNSFSKLVGDSPDNYRLVDLTTEYGALSNNAIVEYENMLLFLDEKGIVEFNGANWQIISHVLEPTMRRMNISAAREKAVAIHNQFRNQVWFGIPVDGSTENNLTVVYDYLLNAWTFFDGFNPASFAQAKRELGIDRIWYGDYSGVVSHFSPSFYSDNGSGITCLIETKFDSPDGENIQNRFRRLFLDVNTPSGVTGVINVEVRSDYDTTAQATFSIYQDKFQTRRDFGVQGKSIGFKMSHNSASLPLDIYGYTVHRRFLREV